MFSNDYCSPQLTGCDFTSNTATVDGGGMANYNDSSPTLDTCTFEGNTAASDGGGIYNAGNCSPQLTGCDFTSNTATVGGGGMNNFDHSSPILTTCTFTSNDAGFAGGGMCSNSYCSPQLTGCTFTSNTADVNGGGMGNFNDSSPILTTCTFTTNSADYDGGGISNYNSLLTFTDCTFSGNSTTIGDGGGMYNQSCSATSAITGCTFNGNTAASDGGGIFSYDTDLEVTGCTFTGNTADVSGGGMYNYHYSSPTVTNCTFSSNTADFYGGGIYNAGNCSPQLTNCILWGDTPDEICNDDVDSVPVVTYCDVQGGYGDPADNNINANPQFVNAGTGDFHLLGGSPCIDVGDNAAVPGGLTTDIDGQPRILNGVVDMGIDECLAQVWVDNHWAGTTPGEEVNGYIFGLNAFAVIQDGIDAVVAGGTVNVYPGDGAYVEPPIVISKSLTLQSVSGDWHDTTIDDCLDAEIVIRDITSPFSGDAVISGFTISGGYYGIAIPEGLTADGSVTVSNCLIYENTNTGIYAGGELYGDIFIDECIIGENGSTAGIHLASIAGTVEITNSVIGAYWDGYMVSWGNAGNGIQLDSIYETGTVLIDNCKITDNGGHGITDFISGCYGQLTITNNIIGTYYYDLTSGEGEVGGNTESGIYIDHVGATGVVTIEGNRIAQNYYGIEFAGTATIDGEVIINNNYIGAWTQSDGSNYNQYHGNHERGISVENVSTLGTLIITNNLIADNAYSGPKTGISLPLEGGVFITTTSGATVISANIIGAWTEDVAGVGPITYGGNGGPGIMVGEVAGGSLLIIGNTLAENFDTTLTGIHIDLAADTAEVNVHLNNILNNDGDGLYYNDGGVGYLNVIDAENNWWGDASGPGTVGLGTGDEVSDNVDYTPWLGVSVDNALAGTLNDSTLDATTANNTQVIVDGNATVITAQYSGDPGTGGFGGATGQYIDVYVDDPTGVTELEIRLYYTDADIASLIETSLKLSWWDGTSWLVCSDSGVNTDDIPPYSGYIWALIRTDTTPTLAQLTGSVFGGGGTPMLSPIGTGDTTGPIISEVATNCYGGVTETTADICWITNEPATSQVEYEASPGMLSPIDTNLVTTHHIQLTGLTPGTTYHYRTMSRDAYFNLTVSEWFTFTTLGGVTPAAAFTSSDLIISPAEVASGETVAIGVLVTNTGDLAGSYQVTLEINGVAEETIEVTLDAGAGEVVSFTVSRDEAGSYSVLVDGLSGSFSVTEPDTSQPTSPATTEEEPTSNIWPIVGGVIAAVVVIGLAVFVIRRRFA
jgi:predicted outer membrane repeat protein/parallel beta-helix repeat protein